jgi:chaperonin GroES
MTPRIMRPLFDRIIVQREDAPDKTPGGILLPTQAQEKPNRGKVIAVGDGNRTKDGSRVPMDVECGDVVVFGAYAGNEVEIDGEKLLILSQQDVLAVHLES